MNDQNNKNTNNKNNLERLQKYIASCGVTSRRKAEELIASGRVTVNGEVVTEQGTKVSHNDIVCVDGKVIENVENVYYVMNKPRGIISSVNDEKGRKTVISILPQELQNKRLFPVGRLDYDTKGVLILTNDGEFMNTLVGPQSNLEKEYLARIEGVFKKEHLTKLCSGLKIDDYVTRRCYGYIESVDMKNKSSLVGLVIKEGKYHQVKKMFETLGFPVKRLTRIRFGEITTEGLKEGDVRKLSIHEVKRLYVLANKK